MPSIDLKYGDSKMKLEYEEKNLIKVLDSNPLADQRTEEQIIQDALANPIASARLKELVRAGQSVCIVIPDSTRLWQKSGLYLPFIVDELTEAGVKDEDILFLSATGTHRRQSQEEHDALLGPKLAGRFKVVDHDSLDEDNMVYLGTTTYGTPVKVNRMALDCDHIILAGGIVYHFLAGFAGGRKYVLPGISSYETVMKNHALSLSENFGGGTDPRVRSGNLGDNPIHLDMQEAASFVRPTFIFNVIMGATGNIAAAVAGNYIMAHAEGCKMVDAIDGSPITDQADLVVATAGGFPKDINLYQTVKTVINTREAAKRGGSIIILSECRDGVGGNEDVQKMILGYDSMEAREKALRDDYSISKFVAYYLCETAVLFDLILVTSIDPELLKKANIKAASTLDEALEMVYKKNGKDLSLYVMPHGANTLPKR